MAAAGGGAGGEGVGEAAAIAEGATFSTTIELRLARMMCLKGATQTTSMEATALLCASVPRTAALVKSATQWVSFCT
jgi:hypothetical protein